MQIYCSGCSCMVWIEVTAIVTGTCGSVTKFKPIATSQTYYSLSTLSWRGRKTDKIGIHLIENGSNQRHVIFDGR